METQDVLIEQLETEIPGLEAAKKAIDLRLEKIQQLVLKLKYNPDADSGLPDDTILGIDSRGRINRRRNITEETRAKRYSSIALAREARARKQQERMQAEVQAQLAKALAAAAATPPPAPTPVPPTTEKKGKHGKA